MIKEERNLRDRILSLAGIFQVAVMVQILAKTGRTREPYFTASIESLFKIDSCDVPDVYGGIPNLKLGLEAIIALFSQTKEPKDAEIARYVLSLLHLERKLDKDPKKQKRIQEGVRRAQIQSTHFSTTHDNVMANLASLYTDTLSTFRFRIYVSGEPVYLNQTVIINKVRALLFAGIRSSVLWRQMGGRRWQFLISRRSILETAKALLTQIKQTETA